jgi:all-trans-nonaprenyl-diphosphate synthase
MDLADGEVRQGLFRYDTGQSFETYLEKSYCKTASLIANSARAAGVLSGLPAPQLDSLYRFGRQLGLAFQVVDDVLDVTQASEVLGKTAGKDLEQNKPTYVQLMGLERARNYARELRAQARDALAVSGLTSTGTLSMIADKVVDREN